MDRPLMYCVSYTSRILSLLLARSMVTIDHRPLWVSHLCLPSLCVISKCKYIDYGGGND